MNTKFPPDFDFEDLSAKEAQLMDLVLKCGWGPMSMYIVGSSVLGFILAAIPLTDEELEAWCHKMKSMVKERREA